MCQQTAIHNDGDYNLLSQNDFTELLKQFCLLVEPWNGMFAFWGLFLTSFLFPILGNCPFFLKKRKNIYPSIGLALEGRGVTAGID